MTGQALRDLAVSLPGKLVAAPEILRLYRKLDHDMIGRPVELLQLRAAPAKAGLSTSP